MSSPTEAGSIPDSAIALAPAMAAASAKVTSSGHHRRSEMPARASSIPGRRPTRSYVSRSWSSSSAEVTMIGASTAETDSTAVSANR